MTDLPGRSWGCTTQPATPRSFEERLEPAILRQWVLEGNSLRDWLDPG